MQQTLHIVASLLNVEISATAKICIVMSKVCSRSSENNLKVHKCLSLLLQSEIDVADSFINY